MIPPESGRTFFLILDAVPYTSVAALYARGEAVELFAQLGEPIPLISTFPSTTSVALSAALGPLGLEPSPGYEARFFDWDRGAVRGGGPISYFRIEFPWRDFFHWSKKGVGRSALASLRPVAASEGRVLSAFEAFLSSGEGDFFAYVETTDTAAHLRGPAALDRMFDRLGRAISVARAEGERFRVVVFSDHGIAGSEVLTNVLPGVLDALEHSGFKRTGRLKQERDVVLTPYGLVSSFEAYSRAEVSPHLAEVLTSVEGVDLCAYRHAEQLWVVSAEGLAMIARRGELWSYSPQVGDPLQYREVLDELEVGVPSAEGGWFPDADWFQASWDEFYPDALHRIAESFDLVEHPASVVCSLEPGFMYGPKRTERAARLAGGRLRWTHGALFWEASAGFLLTDVETAVRNKGLRLGSALPPLLSGGGARPVDVIPAASASAGRAN